MILFGMIIAQYNIKPSNTLAYLFTFVTPGVLRYIKMYYISYKFGGKNAVNLT